MDTQFVAKRIVKILSLVGSDLLLVGTWGMLFVSLEWTVHNIFVYWASAPEHSPLGTLERPMRHFFAAPPGSVFPLIVTGASAILLIVGTARAIHRARLFLAFAATNLAFLCAQILLGNLAWNVNAALLPRPRPSIDVGYLYTWPVAVVTIVLLLLLFLAQSKLALGTRSKAM